MTPEDVLSSLAAHAATMDFRKPDPLVEAVRAEKSGKRKPNNWREIFCEPLGEPTGAAAEALEKHRNKRYLPPIGTAIGTDTRRSKKGALHELAVDALKGMPKVSFQAIQAAINVDAGARRAISVRLISEARRSQEKDSFWPCKLARRTAPGQRAPHPDYTVDLVELTIMQLQHPNVYATNESRANWFGLSSTHWRRKMQKPFGLLSGCAWRWYNVGVDHIQYRINRARR